MWKCFEKFCTHLTGGGEGAYYVGVSEDVPFTGVHFSPKNFRAGYLF